jgi:transcriptional regulator with XRE-family HTH domain
MIKQPELGQKISELRKAKGLTQEELVEKCNISVRTIQRIETGEVTPRSYTVKTILAALEYDFGKISFEDVESPGSSNVFKNFFLVDVDTSTASDFVIRQLRMAWIFGVIYFVLGCLEGAAEYFRFAYDEMIFGTTGYIIIKILVLITVIVFKRGFVIVADYYQNYLLKVMAIVLIGAYILLIGYDIVSTLYDSSERLAVLIGESVAFGGIGLIYGVALMRLEKPIGTSAKVAGIFEVVAACLSFSVVFAFLSELAMIPAELLGIIVLFKAMELMKGNVHSRRLATN